MQKLRENAKNIEEVKAGFKEELRIADKGILQNKEQIRKLYEKKEWVLVSVAQQEIDRMEADCKEKSEGYAKVCARLHEQLTDLTLKDTELKQKLKSRPLRPEFETEQSWLVALSLWFEQFERLLK
jgi:hypothetical protein